MNSTPLVESDNIAIIFFWDFHPPLLKLQWAGKLPVCESIFEYKDGSTGTVGDLAGVNFVTITYK